MDPESGSNLKVWNKEESRAGQIGGCLGNSKVMSQTCPAFQRPLREEGSPTTLYFPKWSEEKRDFYKIMFLNKNVTLVNHLPTKKSTGFDEFPSKFYQIIQES